MRTPRIYVEVPSFVLNTEVTLNKEQTHYLSRVLRLKPLQLVTLFNGQNHYEYSAKIKEIQKNAIVLDIIDSKQVFNESPLSIHLGQAISKGEKLDLVIQKATELGVQEITPLITHRSECKKSNLDKKHAHWIKIAISAAEQCGRTKILNVHAPTNFEQWLTQKTSIGITLDPTASLRLIQNLFTQSPPKNIQLLIGPEGGLTPEEIKLSQQHNFKSVSLGNRILRTETAPLAAISILQNLWGDL